jgi:hypothetical protein
MKKLYLLLIGVLIVPLMCNGDIKKVKAEEDGNVQTVSESPALSEITVIGLGKSKEDALDKAFHKAVENVTGAWVWGYTEVNKGKLIEDKILVHVKGFVKDHEIVEDKTLPNGDVVLTVKVKVDTAPIRNILRDAKVVTRDVVIGDLAAIKQTQERLKRSVKVLKTYLGTDKAEFVKKMDGKKCPRTDQSEFIEKAYNFDYIGYEIDDIGMDYIKGNILVRISLNKEWWDGYFEIVKQVSQEKSENTVEEGFLNDPKLASIEKPGPLGTTDRYSNPEYTHKINFYYVHKSLRPYFVPPILIKVGNEDIILYMNGLKQLTINTIEHIETRRNAYNYLKENLSTYYVNDYYDRPIKSGTSYGIGRVVTPFKDAYILKLPFTFKSEKEVNNFISNLKLKYTVVDRDERDVIFYEEKKMTGYIN